MAFSRPWTDDPDRFLADADWHNLEDNWDFGLLDPDAWDHSSHAHDDLSRNDLASHNLRSSPSNSPLTSTDTRSPLPPPTSIHTSSSTSSSSSFIQNTLRPTTSSNVEISDTTSAHQARVARTGEASTRTDNHASVTVPNHFGYYPDQLWDQSANSSTSAIQRRSPVIEVEEGSMPSVTRQGNQGSRMRIVDLTNETGSPPAGSSQKRKLPHAIPLGHEDSANKRGRLSVAHAGAEKDIEAIDLSNEQEFRSIEEALLTSQQQAAIKAQQEVSEGPQRIGKHTCIICMEPFTNLTTTVCGHPFCHECLIQALMAGEKNSESRVGNCPVCRKPLKRNTKSVTLVPILLMKKSTFKAKMRRDEASRLA